MCLVPGARHSCPAGSDLLSSGKLPAPAFAFLALELLQERNLMPLETWTTSAFWMMVTRLPAWDQPGPALTSCVTLDSRLIHGAKVRQEGVEQMVSEAFLAPKSLSLIL